MRLIPKPLAKCLITFLQIISVQTYNELSLKETFNIIRITVNT